MLEKLRDNPRVVVAALVVAGILAVAIGASNNNNSSSNTNAPTDETTSEVDTADESQMDEQTADEAQDEATNNEQENESDAMSTTPVAGPVEVSNEEGALKATVRKGDNQTVIVRQMIADYLESKGENLSAEQRLYAETNLVNQLPRMDVIYPNAEIKVEESAVESVVGQSKQLDEAAIARWSKYL